MVRGDSKHGPLKVWLMIVMGSLLFSGFIVIGGPTITGYAVLDSGPSVELNPDIVGQEEYNSNLLKGGLAIIFLVAAQVVIYLAVTKMYKGADEDEL